MGSVLTAMETTRRIDAFFTHGDKRDQMYTGARDKSGFPRPTVGWLQKEFPDDAPANNRGWQNNNNSSWQNNNNNYNNTTQNRNPQRQSDPPAAAAAVPAEKKMTFAEKMMAKQGWVKGEGLGKKGSGITEAIKAEERFGRAGLGTEKSVIQAQSHSLDAATVVKLTPEVDWITCDLGTIAPDVHSSAGIRLAGLAEPAYDYDLLCSKEIVDEVFATKNKFNGVNREIFSSARERANPYETIKSHIFMNRAAVKMAEIDHMLALFELMCPALLQDDGTLYFADVCAGPGGFSEYVMWRAWQLSEQVAGQNSKHHLRHAECFGFTLAGKDSFNLAKFNDLAPNNTFWDLSETAGDGSGSVYVEPNLRAVEQAVLLRTNNQRVSLYMADGGFSVEGDENLQEVKLQQLILCQFLAGLLLLRPGGVFLCKIFDVFTPFTAGLLHFLYCSFDQFALIKPVTSRPANSERYVVCIGLKEERPAVIDHMFEINKLMNQNKDVREVMSFDKMCPRFLEYVRSSNKKIASGQVVGLKELVMYIEDRNLPPRDQEQVRNKCLRMWNLPASQPKQFGMEDDRRKKWPRGANHQLAAAAALPLVDAAAGNQQRRVKGPKRARGPMKRSKQDGDFDMNDAAVLAAIQKRVKLG